MRQFKGLLFLSLLALLPLNAGASGKAPWDEYDKRIKAGEEVAALGPNLFGDQINLSNGALSFSVTDVSLPGNSGLSVALTRTYQVRDWRYRITDGMMADWQVEVPSIDAVHVGPWLDNNGGQNRCTVAGPPPSPQQYPGMHAFDFWQGPKVNIPGVTSGDLLRTRDDLPAGNKPSTSHKWMTNEQVHFECLSTIKNTSGEGFLAITPDGTRIWFDHMAQQHEPPMRRGSTTVVQGGVPLEYEATIRRNTLLATRVEDRFGNWVTYTYSNGPTAAPRLTQIAANDGRQLSLAYNDQGAVDSVSDGTRTWSYVYGTTTSDRSTLTQVTLPDTSKWTLNLSSFTNAEVLQTEVFQLGEPYRRCVKPERPLNYTNQPVGTMTHPSGATGAFTLALIEHGRGKVPVTCDNVTSGSGVINNENDDVPFFPVRYYAYTLTQKALSGPGMDAAQWNYSYTSGASVVYQAGSTPQLPRCNLSQYTWQECIEPPCQSDSCATRSVTVVTGPGGRWTRYRHGNTFRYDEGKLISVEEGSSDSNILRTTTYSYDLTLQDNADYLASWGTGQRGNGEAFPTVFHRPQKQVVTTQQGQTFTWRADDFDHFARPVEVTRFSNLPTSLGPNSRTDETTYADFPAIWVMGQVAEVFNTNEGRIVEKTVYSSTTGQPVEFYSPGTTTGGSTQKLQTLTYHGDGTIATAKDGNNNITTLSNWYRGVPRLIQFPGGVSQSAVVNALGQITSVTDELGHTTSYQYDNGGRLKKVTYPTGDSTGWAVKNITFAQVPGIEHGIDAGHWRQTITHGNYRKFVYFDAMWRPVVEREHDSTNIAGTERFKRFAYHATGELAFAAYPGTTSALTTGLWHEYDVLGRPTRTEQDSEYNATHGRLVTQYAYLSGFKTRVTNPRGYRTETRFQAFDQPSTDTPVEIIAAVGRPEQQKTVIGKNVLGQTVTLTRSGTYGGSTLSLARTYVYDDQLRLCMRKEPETNTTVYAYDPAGNVAWYAEGRPTNGQDCATTRSGVPTSAKTQHTYDSRNRVTLVNYPGTAVDVGTTYYADGQVSTITAGTSVLTYQYNKRRLLTSEQTQTPFINWTTTHSYSNLGHLGATTYPNGHAVSFAPNALGQATQAGPYATAATYFPNGALKSFTYDNGLQHTLTLNARQLPERSKDALGTNVVLDDTYDYDFNGNVAGITDGLPGQPGNRDMSYDALDRLVGVVAGPDQGGNGVFAYDPLANIRQLDQGARTGRHQYDATTNRLTALKNAAGTTLSTYAWDARGNLTSRTEGSQTHSFTFDTANRLTATSLGASSYEYDGLGRRTRETSGGLATYYQYSRAGQLLYAEDYKTARSNLYIYLSGSQVAKRTLMHATGALQTSYQHTDALGSLVAATTDTGTVQRRERMTAYGEPVDGSWANGHGFTGHQNDAATKLVYMQQRYYDPVIGRFLSADPVATDPVAGSMFNRYYYANGNPYRYIDPDGRTAVCNDTSCWIDCRSILTCTADRLYVESVIFVRHVQNAIDQNQNNESAEEEGRSSRPPAGSKPIDETDWSGDHGEIKGSVGAGPTDKVRISRDGEVWVQNPDGTWTNHGDASSHTNSGREEGSGRTGRERDREREEQRERRRDRDRQDERERRRNEDREPWHNEGLVRSRF